LFKGSFLSLGISNLLSVITLVAVLNPFSMAFSMVLYLLSTLFVNRL